MSGSRGLSFDTPSLRARPRRGRGGPRGGGGRARGTNRTPYARGGLGSNGSGSGTAGTNEPPAPTDATAPRTGRPVVRRVSVSDRQREAAMASRARKMNQPPPPRPGGRRRLGSGSAPGESATLPRNFDANAARQLGEDDDPDPPPVTRNPRAVDAARQLVRDRSRSVGVRQKPKRPSVVGRRLEAPAPRRASISEFLFGRLKFCIELPTARKIQMQRQLRENGGIVSALLCSSTSHLVTTEASLSLNPFKMKTAMANNVHIVSPEFVDDCIEAGMLLDETDYLVYDYGSMSALPPSDSEESNADSGADDGSGTIHGANPYGSGHKMITDYYILGDSNTAKNLKLLQALDVGWVLNMTVGVDNYYKKHFKYKRIQIPDRASANIRKHFGSTFKFISKAKAAYNAGKEKSRIYVHCQQGISRSATITIAYLMQSYGWPLLRAYDHVKALRRIIHPNPGFMQQLMTFEVKLIGSSSVGDEPEVLWKEFEDRVQAEIEEKLRRQQETREIFNDPRIAAAPAAATATTSTAAAAFTTSVDAGGADPGTSATQFASDGDDPGWADEDNP